MFNGVQLPKGSLFTKSPDDGGWAFTRLTPFSLDDLEQQMAFGSEITKTYGREYRAVQELGNTSLQALINESTDRTTRQ